jgi:hypothetical protein
MAALDLNTIMDAIGTALSTITGLRVYDFTAGSQAPPAASVGLPPDVEYDFTKGRGSDRVVVPVTVLVGKVSDRTARDELSAYLAGSGAKSIKAKLDGNLGGAAQTVRVTGASTQIVTMTQGVEYLGATFDVEVVT